MRKTDFDDETPTVQIKPETMQQLTRKFESQWEERDLFFDLEVDESDMADFISDDEPTVKMGADQ